MEVTKNHREFIWSQAYRPKTIEDCVLPQSIKDALQSYVTTGRIPNMLLHGAPGTGKTSAAMAMCDQIGADYIMINGSLDMNLGMMRTTIQQFASTVSFSSGQKVIIIDEADGTPPQVQAAMKVAQEEFSESCSFVMTANNKFKLIDPLISRCAEIPFQFAPSEKPKLASQFFKRVCYILDNEKITYEKPIVVELITSLFPDFRRTLNQLQMYAASGTVDTGILVMLGDKPFKELVGILRDKNFTLMRKWVVDNAAIDASKIFRELYDRSVDILDIQSIPEMVLLLAKYQYQHQFVADKELNLAALLLEIMSTCQFKPT